eukprot:g4037.t1
MASREECLFDPLSGGLFDDNATGVFGSDMGGSATTEKSGSVAANNSAGAPSDNAPPAVSTSTSLFDDDDLPAAPAHIPSTSDSTECVVSEGASDFLGQVDLSKISVVQKIDRSSKRKKNKKKATAQAKAAASVAKINKNHGLLGADEDDDDLDLGLRHKNSEGATDILLFGEEDSADEKGASAPGLFDSGDSDDETGGEDQKGGKSSGAYVKRLLTEDKPDGLDTNIADLSVAKMLTTESDTAGGLIESNNAAENARAAATLAERTSDELLNVADDDDLAELMAATQISRSVEDATTEDETVDLFSVDHNDDAIDDDLFSMMGTEKDNSGGNGIEMSAEGDMSSIDAYISAQKGAGTSLFD